MIRAVRFKCSKRVFIRVIRGRSLRAISKKAVRYAAEASKHGENVKIA